MAADKCTGAGVVGGVGLCGGRSCVRSPLYEGEDLGEGECGCVGAWVRGFYGVC